MSELVNLTPFAATCLPSMTRDDEQLTLVVVSGRFLLPSPRARAVASLALAEVQGEVPLADEHTADPAASSLRREGQAVYTRPGTDVYLVGHAWAPGERPTPRSVIALSVGPCQKGAVVFGDRVWSQGVTVGPGRAQPFTRLPLVYERCFGGSLERASGALALASERNPVGRGLFASEREAVGQLMPNFEDPQALVSSPADLPRPCGFGPIARHWRPRRDFAGTYDQQWMDARLPLWPKDMDERFFLAAAPELQARPHLRGGEPVRVVGMHPEGDFALALPRYRLRARFEQGRASVRRALVLDAVEIDTDAGTLTLTWRASLVSNPLDVSAVVVRALDDWEADS